MRMESVSTLATRRDAKLKSLAAVGPFISATLSKVRTRCGNPNCRCAGGERHEAHLLTKKVKGRTVSAYVPKDLLPEVEKWTREWKRLKKVLSEVSALNERIVRLHSRSRRAALKNKSRAARTLSSPSTPG
jgi:hypothetical protein